MSPCGCKKDMSNVEGFFKMRFICDANKKLLKGAPGNFKCGEIYMQPFRLSKFPYWELVEAPPTLKIPEVSKSDSVFEETIFVPDDDEAMVEERPMPKLEDVNIDPDAPAVLEPYMKLNLKTGKLTAVPDEPTLTMESATPVSSQPRLDDEPNREELKKILSEAGVEYSDKARTATLKKMVDELAPKE